MATDMEEQYNLKLSETGFDTGVSGNYRSPNATFLNLSYTGARHGF
jgi:hypothetical protein